MKIVGTLSQRIFFQVSPTKYFPINLIDLKKLAQSAFRANISL